MPFTKQPPVASVVGSGATAVHCAARDEGMVLMMPLTPDWTVQVTPLVSKPPFGVTPKPWQVGMELEPDVKSLGFP